MVKEHYTLASPPEKFVQSGNEKGGPPPTDTDAFRRLVAIMDRLRGPGGCPWDREQTHETLQQYLIEESYEVLDAIADRDDLELCEELGDVLLQVVFHAQLAAEEPARFTIDDVCEAICAKLIRRHPHVFAETDANDAGQVLRNWEQIKLAEKAEKAARKGGEGSAQEKVKVSPIFKGIPKHMPGLQRAARAQEKAARVGFDWPQLAPVLDKVREELDEWMVEIQEAQLGDLPNPHLEVISGKKAETEYGANAPQKLPVPPAKVTEEFGDLLFAMVNAARFLGIEPEAALQQATNKFTQRYTGAEKMATEDGEEWSSLSLDGKDAYWNRMKKAEQAK